MATRNAMVSTAPFPLSPIEVSTPSQAGFLSVVMTSQMEPELLLARNHWVSQAAKMSQALDVEACDDVDRLNQFAAGVTRFGVSTKDVRKQIEDERKRLKDPLTQAGKAIDARFKELSKPIEDAQEVADKFIRRVHAQIATLAARAAREAGDSDAVHGIVVSPPTPIRTEIGTASVRRQPIVVLEDIVQLAIARPDLVEAKVAEILAELRTGKTIPGVSLGEKEFVQFR